MRDIVEHYADAVIGAIAVLEIIAIIVELMLFSDKQGTLTYFVETMTARFL